MATKKQKAAARRNIKKAQAANRRHGGKHKRKSHRSSRSSAGATTKSEAIGSAYINGKLAVQVFSPVTASVISNPRALPAQMKTDFGSGIGQGKLNASLAMGEGSAIAQRWADKKIGQAAALSRGSVTAWIAEALPVAEAYVGAKGSGVLGAHDQFVIKTTGYSPNAGTFHAEQAIPYVAVKYGAGVARKALNKFPIVARPLKKALSSVGASL